MGKTRGCLSFTRGIGWEGLITVSHVDVVDIDEFCLHDLNDMVIQLGYGVVDLMYCHFLRSRLSLDYSLHPSIVDGDVLELEKYVKDNKIILVYVEHGSTNVETIFTTPRKGVVMEVDNQLRNDPIDVDSSPNDLDYDQKYDEGFDDDDHILQNVPVSMSNFTFNPDTKNHLSLVAVEVDEQDLDVIDYDSFDINLDDGIDPDDSVIGKNIFSHTIVRGPVIRENNTSGKQNVLGKGKRVKRKVQDQMPKHFDVGISKMKAFRAKRIATDKMTCSFREQYAMLREYAQELINSNPDTTVRIDVIKNQI
ncbi:hypothetical protein Tco_0054446 [Tanacetum coccineum]